LTGGLPCPPFSKAGKQLGVKDDRNLFPETIRIIDEIRPRAVLIENVRGLLDAVFDDFRNSFQSQLESLGYSQG
jgi:DNA (cytosine-5)-methyltransferase 1